MSKYLKITIDTGFVTGKHTTKIELPDDWGDWDQEEQDEFVNEAHQEFLWEKVGVYSEEIEE